MSLAKLAIIGNLVRDPETKTTADGKQVTEFTVAVNDPTRKDDPKATLYIRCSAWEGLARVASQYLTKGSPVYVEGRPALNSYQTREGETRTELRLTVRDLTLIGGKRDSDGAAAPRAQAPAAAYRQPEPVADEPNDLPF